MDIGHIGLLGQNKGNARERGTCLRCTKLRGVEKKHINYVSTVPSTIP